MKKLVCGISIATALVVCSAALAAGTLSGTYKTTIHTTAFGGQLSAAWTLTFDQGVYTVTRNGQVANQGEYSINGSEVTFTDPADTNGCQTPGTYAFELVGNTVRFTKVSDENPNCAPRTTVLTYKAWKGTDPD